MSYNNEINKKYINKIIYSADQSFLLSQLDLLLQNYDTLLFIKTGKISAEPYSEIRKAIAKLRKEIKDVKCIPEIVYKNKETWQTKITDFWNRSNVIFKEEKYEILCMNQTQYFEEPKFEPNGDIIFKVRNNYKTNNQLSEVENVIENLTEKKLVLIEKTEIETNKHE
jgi:hypothetical protein